ncbi:redoxin domain-containing protein [Paenisporosarcina quisquiliarum]|uniref:redoxin domain-containing protein n=1 Tax=Paenisporosarcina quisquiliarum TaxID=365346 RepID=UPI003736618E
MTKKVFGLILVAALIAIAVTSMVKKNVDQEDSFDDEQRGVDLVGVAANEGLNKGEQAPDFELTTLAGEPIRLSELQGKKVILNFWATWCPPCKAEMPHMQNFYEDYAEAENVEIVAVNLTSGDREASVEEFVKDYGLTFPIPMDVEGEVGQKFQAVTIPTSYIIDTNGLIQHKIVGPMDETMIQDFVSNIK